MFNTVIYFNKISNFYVIFSIILYSFISYNLYAQNNNAKPTFEEFMNKYSVYDKYIAGDIDFLAKVPSIQKLWGNTYQYIENLGSSNWIAIMKDPSKIYRYTDNNDVALLLGASSGLAYLYEGNIDKMNTLVNKLKRKINMNVASGDNYGLIIPLHYPLGTIGLSTYVNFQLPDNKIEGI